MKQLCPTLTPVLIAVIGATFCFMESMGQVGAEHPILRSSFDAVDFSADSAYNAGIIHITPNPSMGAGPRHLVCIAGSSIGIYSKDGALQRGASLTDFFSLLHPLRDPLESKAIFDQFSGRFLVMAIDRSDTVLGDSVNTSRILLAVSVTDNPMAGWWFTAINSKLTVAGLEMAAEYADLAVSAGRVFLSLEMFTFIHPRACGGLRLFIVQKGEIGGFYDGEPAAFTTHAPFGDTVVAEIPRDRLVKMFGAPKYAGEMFLVSYSPIRGSDEVDRLAVTSVLVQPQGNVSFWVREVALGVHDKGPDLPDAPQPGTERKMSTFGKFVYDATWRSEILYVAATGTPVSGPDVTQATVRWFALDTYNTPYLILTGSGDVGGEDIAAGTYTYYPSLAVDPSSNLAIGFAASGPDLCPGAYFTAGLASDPGGVYGGSGVLREGVDYYDRSADPADTSAPSAWGLHTTTCVDPTDGSFWFCNAYAGERATAAPDGEAGRWRTAVGHFYPSDWTDVSTEATLPEETTLGQNYPNPFNPSTVIRYGLAERSRVTLTVFNALGQEVATLADGEMEAGYHEVVFDASGLASGVYLYRLTAGSFVETRKLVLVH